MANSTLARVLRDIKSIQPEELQLVRQAVRAHLADRDTPNSTLTPAEIEAANALLRETMVTLPAPTGIDNEQIDADLAKEYSDD